jgi:RND family efflux transporter MFP subunit
MSAFSPTSVPMPPRRLLTRLVLPAVLVAGAAGALLWTGWRSLMPVPTVDVVPVSVRAAAPGAPAPEGVAATQEGAPIQAPGWVEPSPFPVMVPALTPGIVRSVKVLEGERVAAGQVLVELVDDEQRIALQLSEAALKEVKAKRAEMQDELRRKEGLVESGAASAGEVARLRLRIDAMAAAEQAADADRRMKELALARTQVRAPAAGVVMARLAVPGMSAGAMQDGKPLVELYDPAELQVRADVPLADAGRLAPGMRAEIALDVLPDRVFRGEVVRILHQADIAKNTVQAKVRIVDPAPELRPEMLARVKLFPRVAAGAPGAARAAGRSSVWVPAGAVDASAKPPSVLVVAGLSDGRGTLERRTIEAAGRGDGAWVPVASGLRAGDLVVAEPAGAPAPGTRVRITEKWRDAASAAAKEGAHDGSH